MHLEQVGRVHGPGTNAVAALKRVDLEVWPGEFIVAAAVLVAAQLAQLSAMRAVYRIDIAKVVRERSL